jgi:hypothetical protein
MRRSLSTFLICGKGPSILHAMEFRPLTAADLPLVASWLTRPHVAEWWDGPIALEPGLRQVLALLDGEAIGYAQSYRAADFVAASASFAVVA